MRVVFALQVALAAAAAVACYPFAGMVGASAAAAGGGVGLAGSLAYGLCLRMTGRRSGAQAIMRSHFFAEAAKVGVILTLLPLALGFFSELAVAPFITGFVASLMAYLLALLLDKRTTDFT